MRKFTRILSILLAFAMIASLAACGDSKPENDPPADNPPTVSSADPQPADTPEDDPLYIEVSREGEVEKIPVEKIKGVAANYTIAMDPEYFTFSSDGESDTFTYEDWGGSTNVYYSIYLRDMTAQECARGIEFMYGDNYADCVTEQATIGLYDAVAVYLYDELRDKDAQMRFYMIDTEQGCLVIEAQFVFEMYEGLYAIMRACFDTLTITQSGEANNQSSALEKMQKQISDEGALMGVAYLGYYDKGMRDAVKAFKSENFWDEFSFIGEVDADHCALAEGAEWYAIIPADADVKLTVYEYYFDYDKDYIEGVNPGPGREYISVSDGKAVLLRGNISDIMPNYIVKAEEKGGSVVEYSPSLSLENGRVWVNSDSICDVTPYDRMDMFADNPVTDAAFCGTWQGYESDGDGELYALLLTLNPDGTAEYKYGYQYTEPNETFRGTWEESDGVITLDMTGGPQGYEDFYDTTIRFEWEIDNDPSQPDTYLFVLHIADSSPFLYGGEGAPYWMTLVTEE